MTPPWLNIVLCCGWQCWDTEYLVHQWMHDVVMLHSMCQLPGLDPWRLWSNRHHAIDTVTADTETGLVSGFAWLIYFNVAMTEQLETETDAWDSRLETWDSRPRLRLETETETETQGFETETLQFESQDVSRPRLESRELHLCKYGGVYDCSLICSQWLVSLRLCRSRKTAREHNID